MSVIALSRGSLSATRKLAEGLSAQLGNKIVTREQVIEAALPYGIKNTGLAERDVLERHPPGLWDNYADKRKLYLTCFKAALLDFALHDSIIYHGHLAHILLSGVPFVFRVRLDAPFEYRIKSLMEDQSLSREDAIERIKDIDRRRMRWSEFLYGVDPRNYFNYDLVLNLERMNVETAIQLVAAAAERKEFQATDELMTSLRNLHLKTVVEASLLNSPRTHGMDLDVTADASTGKVVIRGDVPLFGGHTWDTDIRSAVSHLKEAKEVDVRVKTG